MQQIFLSNCPKPITILENVDMQVNPIRTLSSRSYWGDRACMCMHQLTPKVRNNALHEKSAGTSQFRAAEDNFCAENQKGLYTVMESRQLTS